MFLWTLLASRIDCYLIHWHQIAFTYFTLNSRFCIMYLQNEASPSFVFLRFRISLFIDDCNFPLLRWVRWVFQVSSYQAMAINDYDLLKFCYTAFLVVFTLWEVAFDSYNVNISNGWITQLFQVFKSFLLSGNSFRLRYVWFHISRWW